MRPLPIAVLAVLISGTALASPIDGRWAYDASACNAEAGSGDVGANVFAGNTLTYYESECTITNVTPIGDRGQAWRIQADCSGEGETWKTDAVFGIEHGPDGNPRQLVEVDMTDGFVVVMQACK